MLGREGGGSVGVWPCNRRPQVCLDDKRALTLFSGVAAGGLPLFAIDAGQGALAAAVEHQNNTEGCLAEQQLLTSFSKRTGANDEVGARAADETHDIVGGLQVMPKAHILMIEHII